jgi:ABC-type proline/glycine betaine transport system permease subunit
LVQGLAAAIVLFPGVAGSVLPVAVALRSVPIVTTAPLIVLALGRGAAGTVTIVAVMIFFPTLVACLQGLRQTPGQVMDVFDSYAADRWQRLIFAQIPAMLPAFFASARMAVPAAFLAATTAEWLATGTGHGQPDGADRLHLCLQHAVERDRAAVGHGEPRLCRGRLGGTRGPVGLCQRAVGALTLGAE